MGDILKIRDEYRQVQWAAVGFQYCSKLFAEEHKCAVYKPQYRREYRQNKELPLLEEYFAWLKTAHPEKGSKLEEAIRYSLNRKQQLCTFLGNGEVPKPAQWYTPWWKAQRQTE